MLVRDGRDCWPYLQTIHHNSQQPVICAHFINDETVAQRGKLIAQQLRKMHSPGPSYSKAVLLLPNYTTGRKSETCLKQNGIKREKELKIE